METYIIVLLILGFLFLMYVLYSPGSRGGGNALELTQQELSETPTRFNGQVISTVGTYNSGFEVSSLNDDIWVDFAPGYQVFNKPCDVGNYRKYPVHITGRLESEPGTRYGHLGGYRARLVADKIIYNPNLGS